MAARYARDAAFETKRGADAAERAIYESRRAGETQSQAYLSVVRADVHFLDRQFGKSSFPDFRTVLHFHNSGNTPAINVSYFCTATLQAWSERAILPETDFVRDHTFVTNVTPNHSEAIKVVCWGIAEPWRGFVKGWSKVDADTQFGEMPMLVIHGVVFYEDVFGRNYRSKFAFTIEGEETELPLKIDCLPTVQAFIPTFEPIEDRTVYIRRNLRA